MPDLIFRCSRLASLVSEPKDIDAHLLTPAVVEARTRRADKRTATEQALIDEAKRHSLSVGAKSAVHIEAALAIFGVEEFEGADSRAMEKGRRLEQQAIEVVARVRGWPELFKNQERRGNGFITGEADIVVPRRAAGRDIKVSWSMQTFPLLPSLAVDTSYWWQMQGYMILWDCDEWHVDYVLLDTPEDLIGAEPWTAHMVSHVPEHLRVTTWTVQRDPDAEALIRDKVLAARRYFDEVIREFDRTHQPSGNEGEATYWRVPTPAKPRPADIDLDPAPAAPQPTQPPVASLEPQF